MIESVIVRHHSKYRMNLKSSFAPLKHSLLFCGNAKSCVIVPLNFHQNFGGSRRKRIFAPDFEV